MKRTMLAAAAVAVAALFSVAPAAQAQMANPAQFGIIAGASLPIGDLGDAAETGYHIGGLVNFRPAVSPLGLRAEVVYHNMSGKTIRGTDFPEFSPFIGSLNAMYEFGATNTMSTVKPYFIGGIGGYNYEVPEITGIEGGVVRKASRETKFGLNGGIGTRFALAGFSTFAEARFHNIFVGSEGGNAASSMRFIPLSFGIAF